MTTKSRKHWNKWSNLQFLPIWKITWKTLRPEKIVWKGWYLKTNISFSREVYHFYIQNIMSFPLPIFPLGSMATYPHSLPNKWLYSRFSPTKSLLYSGIFPIYSQIGPTEKLLHLYSRDFPFLSFRSCLKWTIPDNISQFLR